MHTLFVYGTLLFPEIVQDLTGKTFDTKDATLKNYTRARVCEDGEPLRYPGITSAPGKTVKGKILCDVDEESLAIIDAWEGGKHYTKKILPVESGGKEVTAIVYVWNPAFVSLLGGTWNPEDFEGDDLEHYRSVVVPKFHEKMP